MEYKSWFKDLEKTSSEFNDVNNVLECFKFKYKEENHLYEWIIGISAGLYLNRDSNKYSSRGGCGAIMSCF